MSGNPYIDKRGNRYWLNNKYEYHREDGPAIEWWNGDKSWYYNGVWIGGSRNVFTQEDFDKYLRSLKIKEYW